MQTIMYVMLPILLVIFGEICSAYGQDNASIKIGLIVSEQGPYSFFELPILHGIEFALEEENHLTIVHGNKKISIQMVRKDNSVNKTVDLIQDLIDEGDEGVHIIIGPSRSSEAKPLLEEVKLNTVVLSPYATATSLTDPEAIKGVPIREHNSRWFFRATSPDRVRGEALAKWMLLDHSPNDGNIVLIYDKENEYGKGLHRDIEDFFKKKEKRPISFNYQPNEDTTPHSL